jgi:hypothetical protein
MYSRRARRWSNEMCTCRERGCSVCDVDEKIGDIECGGEGAKSCVMRGE